MAEPVLPALTSLLTLALTASVIFARLRTLLAVDFLGLPAPRPLPTAAALSAATNDFRELKPYADGSDSNSLANASSSCATLAFGLFSSLRLDAIMGVNKLL